MTKSPPPAPLACKGYSLDVLPLFKYCAPSLNDSVLEKKENSMEMLIGFLGGIATWPALIILLECIALIACVERFNSGGLAALSVIVALAILYFVFSVSPLMYVIEHPFASVAAVAAYLATGILWARFRLGRYMRHWREEYDAASPNGQRHMFAAKPSLANSKDRIIGWLTFWPWSAAWWVFADMVVEFFNALYKALGGFFGKVIASYLEGITEPKSDDRQPQQRARS